MADNQKHFHVNLCTLSKTHNRTNYFRENGQKSKGTVHLFG